MNQPETKTTIGKDGFYISENGKYCQNCGREIKTREIIKGIWNYGVRSERYLFLCKRCEDF